MMHNVQIEVPEEIYDSALKTAERTGQAPEKLLAEWLSTAAQFIIDDPVEEFIGALDSGTLDLSSEHDRYLGEAAERKLRNEQRGSEDEPQA